MLPRIAVIPNTTKDLSGAPAKELFKRLLAGSSSVFLPEDTKEFFPWLCKKSVCFLPEARLFGNADIIFVLGGDGSVIDAARRAAVYGVPMTGVNFGTVGYLSEIGIDELDLVDKVLSGNYTV